MAAWSGWLAGSEIWERKHSAMLQADLQGKILTILF
jgi:hypothetical protein